MELCERWLVTMRDSEITQWFGELRADGDTTREKGRHSILSKSMSEALSSPLTQRVKDLADVV